MTNAEMRPERKDASSAKDDLLRGMPLFYRAGYAAGKASFQSGESCGGDVLHGTRISNYVAGYLVGYQEAGGTVGPGTARKT